MADERVYKKAHFAPELGAQEAAPLPSKAQAPSPPPQQNGGDLLQQQKRLEQQQQEQQQQQQSPQLQQQQQQAQTLTFPDQKEFTHRRDIYSIHGEQVSQLLAALHIMAQRSCLLLTQQTPVVLRTSHTSRRLHF